MRLVRSTDSSMILQTSAEISSPHHDLPVGIHPLGNVKFDSFNHYFIVFHLVLQFFCEQVIIITVIIMILFNTVPHIQPPFVVWDKRCFVSAATNLPRVVESFVPILWLVFHNHIKSAVQWVSLPARKRLISNANAPKMSSAGTPFVRARIAWTRRASIASDSLVVIV